LSGNDLAMTIVVGTVSEIRRFPVKSMQGELISSTVLDGLGIAGDRRFAVRDLDNGKVLSGKTPKAGPLLLECRARFEGADIVASVNGVDHRVGDASLDAALSALLSRNVQVQACAGADDLYESYWPEIDGMALSDVTVDFPVTMGTGKGTFADLAALHLLATSSVAHLSSLNDELSLSMHRFRPSITVDSGDAVGFVEKDWTNRTGSIGDVTVAFSTESPRCIMTTLNQHDLPRQPAVLQTIAKHNKVDFDGFGAFACLGIYAEVTSAGEVSIGDKLTID
jgi:uncharacterized protein